MWFLQNVKTKELICEGFSSQAKLAQFMGMNPRTLCKAVKEGRNTFKFRGKQVCVLQKEVPRFSVHESSDDPPLKFFEKETQVAEWFGLSRQTIYDAFKLNQTEKTFKKDGKEWIVKRISAESPQESKSPKSSPEKEIPPSPPKPIPAPRLQAARRKTLPPPIPAPRLQAARSRKVLPEKETEKTESFPPVEDPLNLLSKELQAKQDEIDKIRSKNYWEMRKKYYKWFLDPDPSPEVDETMILLFNFDNGTDVPVKDYQDIVAYFDSQGFDFFVDEDEYNDTTHRKRFDFLVSPKDTFNNQEWTKFVFIKDPQYQ